MSETNRSELFDREFGRFKKENPNWDRYLTDSTYYDLMGWYDDKYGLGNELEYSNIAHDFANYVWEKIHENEPRLEMKVRENHDARGYYARGYYTLQNMTEDELRSLLAMIKGACLEERRVFDRVKRQIEKLIDK